MRYEVTTMGNVLLNEFEDYQTAVTYCNAICNDLKIHVKLFDACCGVTIEWYVD